MHENITRKLDIRLPSRQSAFLWGPRKTGKTTYLKTAFLDSIVFDFLDTDLFLRFSRRPALLREQLLSMPQHQLRLPIILDEVQKVPGILDEVHRLIEDKKISFILCGSSARKLKRVHANMLGGRAWQYAMLPLTTVEIKNFNLKRALNQGLIPAHYLQDAQQAGMSLNAYAQNYLKQEVFDEGLTRNIPAFSRFFDVLPFSNGELVNFSNIARDSGIDAKTVKEYFQILVDTFAGIFIEPFSGKQGRQVILKAPKFYLFDVGLAGTLINRTIIEERGVDFGKAFEHFILMEILAYSAYSGKHFPVHFWRTKSGLEVDFILARGQVAVEIKGTNNVDSRDTRDLKSFIEDFSPQKSFLVCTETLPRICGTISIIPWKYFLESLWAGDVV